MPDPSMGQSGATGYSPLHPHEPDIPPALGPDGRCLVCKILTERDELAEEHDRFTAERKTLREVLHSALGYLSAEDDPQARRICQDAALALDGIS